MSFVEIGPVVLEKKKMLNVYNHYDDDNDDADKFRLEKLTWAFGSGELKSRTPQCAIDL